MLTFILHPNVLSNRTEQIYYCVQYPGVMPNNLEQTVYTLSDFSVPNTTSVECSVTPHYSPLVNQSNVAESMFNTQKKRNVVKYRFTDVLPRDKCNQSYYD